MVVACFGAGEVASQAIGGKTALPAGTPSTLCVQSPGKTCIVKVTVTPAPGGDCSGGAITLEPEFPSFGTTTRINRIEFQIVTAGYQFCARSGDGAFFDNAAIPDDLFDVESNKKCDPSFVWKRKKADSNDWAYVLRFRDTANTRYCIKDPWVRNG